MNLLLNNSIWQSTAPREMALVGGNYQIESEEHLVVLANHPLLLIPFNLLGTILAYILYFGYQCMSASV